MIVFAVALIALLTAGSPAYAGIETLIGAQVFAFLSASLGVPTVAALAVTPFLTAGIIGGALYGISSLLSPNLKSPSVEPGTARETFSAAEGPELRGVGRIRVGGLKIFGNTKGDDRFRLIAHIKGEGDGFEEYYLGGREVVVDSSNGAVTSYPWRQGSTSYAFIKTKIGDGTETAWSDLTAAFSTWTANHRVRGIVQSLLKYVNPGFSTTTFLQLYQGGVPDYEAVMRGEKIFDPRTGTTGWSDNGILVARHVLLSAYTVFDADDLDDDFISDQADLADVLVSTKDGDVTRSRAWGVWTSETPRGENMQKLLDSVGAEIVARPGGKIGIKLIDDVPTSELTIEARDIVSLEWKSGPDGVQRPNKCSLTYYSPERNYDKGSPDLSGVAWAKNQDEIDAYGEQKFDLTLPFCPNSGQAQRRARQMFALARADSGIIRTNMVGLACFGCQFVSFVLPDDLGTLFCKIGPPRVLDDEGQVEIPFAVWPTLSAWNTSTDEADAPEQIPDPGLGTELDQPSAPTSACVVTYPDASIHTRVGYPVPSDADLVEAALRSLASGVTRPAPWGAMEEYESTGGVHHAYVVGSLAGQLTEFRLRTYTSNRQNGSRWSPTLQTTPVAVNAVTAAPVIEMISGFLNEGGSAFLVSLRVTAPSDLHVAYLVVSEEGVSDVTVAVKPGQKILYSRSYPVELADYVVDWSVTAYTSNGTASSPDTLAVNVPGVGA